MLHELDNMSDDELISVVRREKNGKEGRDAVSILISRYLKLVVSRAHSCSDVYSDVEDLTQEGLIAFYKAIDSFDPEKGARFSAYADICVSNRIKTVAAGMAKINGALCEPAEEDIAAEEESPESLWLESENAEEMRSALAPLENKVFALYLDGETYKEIAKKLGISEKSVDNAVFRIRKKLKKLLKG